MIKQDTIIEKPRWMTLTIPRQVSYTCDHCYVESCEVSSHGTKLDQVSCVSRDPIANIVQRNPESVGLYNVKLVPVFLCLVVVSCLLNWV